MPRALDEARALAAVEHPALVKIYEIVEHGEAIALVMERVRGQTLDAWIATRPSPATVIAVFETIGRGLAAVHDAGLIHRDVKPANILVDDDGRPRIIDFGLAMSAEPDGIRRSGTEATMAPEQFLGEGVGPWSDQYAWAVAYREALSRVGRGRIPWRLDAVLRRASAHRFEDRFASMRAALATLARRRAVVRGGAWGLGAAVLVAGGLAVPAPSEAACSADSTLELQWGAGQADAVRRRVAGLPGPLADEAAERVVARLDFLADRIATGHRAVCDAERVGQPRAGERACLAELAAAVDQTVQSLHAGSLSTPANAVAVVAMLGDPEQCTARDDRGAVDDPEVLTARGRLRAKSALCASQTADVCRAAFEDETHEGRCGLALDARYHRANGLYRAGDAAGALDDFTDAAWRAEACDRPDVELDAKRLAGVLSAFAGDDEAATLWLSAAEATLRRTGEAPYRAARLELARGLARVDEAPAEAAEILARSVEMLEAFGDGSARERAVALVNLGQARRRAGQIDAAEALRDALELDRRLYGPNAMTVGHTLVSLAGAMHAAGHLDATERYLGEAASIYAMHEAAGRGPRINVERNRCALARERGELTVAAEHCSAALELALQSPELPADRALDAKAALALVRAEQGQLAQAADELQSLRERAEDADVPPRLMDEWTANLAAIEHARERFDRAAELFCSLVPTPSDTLSQAPWQQRLHRGAGCVEALVAAGSHQRAIEIGQPLADALPDALHAAPEAVKLRALITEARTSTE